MRTSEPCSSTLLRPEALVPWKAEIPERHRGLDEALHHEPDSLLFYNLGSLVRRRNL